MAGEPEQAEAPPRELVEAGLKRLERLGYGDFDEFTRDVFLLVASLRSDPRRLCAALRRLEDGAEVAAHIFKIFYATRVFVTEREVPGEDEAAEAGVELAAAAADRWGEDELNFFVASVYALCLPDPDPDLAERLYT